MADADQFRLNAGKRIVSQVVALETLRDMGQLAQVIDMGSDHRILNVTDSKTKAGIRYVAITHPAPMAVIRRRLEAISGKAQLFDELTVGGLDMKLSSSAVKA